MSEKRWLCVECGHTYKTLKTFLRHPCAKAEAERIAQMLDDEDGEGLKALVEEVLGPFIKEPSLDDYDDMTLDEFAAAMKGDPGKVWRDE